MRVFFTMALLNGATYTRAFEMPEDSMAQDVRSTMALELPWDHSYLIWNGKPLLVDRKVDSVHLTPLPAKEGLNTLVMVESVKRPRGTDL